MFIELVDVLRCPNGHEDTWLVLAARYTVDRDIMEGVLGCPICRAEYPIEAGVARFDGGRGQPAPTEPPDEDEALRVAALLDLADSRGYAILVGDTTTLAPRLRDLTDVQLLLVDPPSQIEMGRGLSGLTSSDSRPFPIAEASARAIALDSSATEESLELALRVIANGGRVLAPAGLTVPAGVTELARDDRHWLAERTHAPRTSGIVSLHRRD